MALLGKRFGHTVVEIGETFYVFGGHSSFDGATSDFFSITVAGGSLNVTKLATPPSDGMAPRFAHASFVTGTKVYVSGGNDQDNNQMKDLFAYDVVSGQWTKTDILGSVACEHKSFAVTGGFLVLSGSCGSEDMMAGTSLRHLPL